MQLGVNLWTSALVRNLFRGLLRHGRSANISTSTNHLRTSTNPSDIDRLLAITALTDLNTLRKAFTVTLSRPPACD